MLGFSGPISPDIKISASDYMPLRLLLVLKLGLRLLPSSSILYFCYYMLVFTSVLKRKREGGKKEREEEGGRGGRRVNAISTLWTHSTCDPPGLPPPTSFFLF